jgi:hypothetical protein
MLAATLVFVARYGPAEPHADEALYIPQWLGVEPADAAWLWAQHNEHRSPLPKFVLLALFRLTGDFRAAMFVSGLALGTLAAAMIWTARSVRGRLTYTDAIFPLALLNWGHWENLLFGWQLMFVSSTFFAGMLLVLVARQTEPRLRCGQSWPESLCCCCLSVPEVD